METFEVKNTIGVTIYSCECNSYKECIEKAVIEDIDLSGARLFAEDLSRARLSGLSISGADLSRANLSRADLYGANLSRVDLYGASLSGASLSGANLYGADLSGAKLYGADLSGAKLYGANLYGADLSRADLSGADLSRANLYRANLSNIKMSYIFFKDEKYEVEMFTVINAYKYPSIPALTKCGKQFVRMGCFNRLREEWENDFWNNPSEFPNKSSVNSQKRLEAFKLSCKWIDENMALPQ